MTRVAVLGLWHLGLVTAASLAEMGHEVTGFDQDAARLEALMRGRLPLYEPGLEELVKKNIEFGRLKYARDMRAGVSGADAVLITYDTPVNEEDLAELDLLENTLAAMKPFLNPGSLVLINSQIPVGTCEKWQAEIDAARPGEGIDIVYSPENLRLGQALHLYRRPDMLVFGANTDAARNKASRLYENFDVPKFYVSWRSAEMAKHALNAFLATSISFANEIGNLCDAVGADGMDIARILKADARIGHRAQVRPGLGFAGATLARDITGLRELGRKSCVATLLMDSVLEINRRQTDVVVDLLGQYFEGQWSGRSVAVLGLTYKPGTSTLRRSVSIEIIHRLQNMGCRCRAHDPKADLSESPGGIRLDTARDVYEICKGAHAVLLMTEWPEYRELDFGKIKTQMARPMILDAKNHLDGGRLRELGFLYVEIGRGQLATVKS